jgi:hypothetical protein
LAPAFGLLVRFCATCFWLGFFFVLALPEACAGRRSRCAAFADCREAGRSLASERGRWP